MWLVQIMPHEHGTLYHNRFRTRLLFLSSDGNWRLCCSSRLFRLTNNMSRAVYQRRTVTCLATLTEFDCTVVLQQKCDNATLIIFISTTTTTIICVLLLLPSYSDNLHDNYASWCVCLVICLYLEIKTRVGFSTNGRIFLKRIHFFLPLNVSNHFLHLLHRRLIDRNVYWPTLK